MKKHSKLQTNNIERFAYVFLGIMCLVYLFPMYMAVMASISSEKSVLNEGYKLFPSEFSLDAYSILFQEYGASLMRSIALTVSTGVAQPILSIFLVMCMAYPLSQPDFAGRDFWRKFLVVTMIFSAGLIPTYILRTKYFGLKNNILIYLWPTVAAWDVFLFRTFFVSIDKSMVESAKLDGANKLQILLKIMLPLTKPLVAMNFFRSFLARWNDITTPLYYITDRKLYTVQYLLQEMLRSAQEAKYLLEAGMIAASEALELPVFTLRYALAVIGALPALILFPYLQKYYAKGITLGSTKG